MANSLWYVYIEPGQRSFVLTIVSQHVPIIAVTANARSEQIETALSAGMDDVQPKPFRIPELMERMRGLLQKMANDG